MSSEFQNLFQQGTTAWAIKYFKEEILTALVDDLEKKSKSGIGDDICDQIQLALEEAINSVDVADGNWYRKCFRERLHDVLTIYVEWNNALTEENREQLIKGVRKRKNTIFKNFYNHIDSKYKSDRVDRKNEYIELMKRQRRINDNLANALQILIERYPEFPLLKKRLLTFNKRKNGRKKDPS